MTTHSSSRKPFRLKPAGWLAVAILVVLVVGAAGMMLRSLTAPIRELPPAGATPIKVNPTITPYRAPTKTSVPSATPLPAGWTQGRGLNGQTVFVPPAEVQAEIKAAFMAVLNCDHVEDTSDADLLAQPGKVVLCEQATQASIAGFPMYYWRRVRNGREINKFGPINPIECATLRTCTVVRAKLGVMGVMVTEDVPEPSIYRGEIKGQGPYEPYELYTATVVFEEERWKVADLAVQKLPGPPPSP